MTVFYGARDWLDRPRRPLLFRVLDVAGAMLLAFAVVSLTVLAWVL